MGVLSDFERRLEGAVEGFFARAFRSGLQPVELAKALQRYMEDTRHVTEDGVVVPNLFRFRLNPRDVERLSTYGDTLKEELASVVVRTADERDWKVRGPAVVRMETDEEVTFGRYALNGKVERTDPSATGAVVAESGKTHRGGGGDQRRRRELALRIVRGGDAGRELPLRDDRTVAGRSSDCAITLDDPTVSRRHAAFVNRGDEWWVIDLDSTNGVRVNGTDTGEQRLQPGDRIELGEAVVELVDLGT